MITVREILNNDYRSVSSCMEVLKSDTFNIMHASYGLLYDCGNTIRILSTIDRKRFELLIAETSSVIYTLVDDYIWKRLKESMPRIIIPNLENKLRFSESHTSMLTDYVSKVVDKLLNNTNTPDSLIYGGMAWSLERLVSSVRELIINVFIKTKESSSVKTKQSRNTSNKIVLKLKRLRQVNRSNDSQD